MVSAPSRSLGLLLLLLLTATCQQRRSNRAAVNPAALQGTWLQAQEETRGDTLVYRPNTYKFGPSRGRTGFAIGTAGRFTEFDIAPTDGLIGHDGTWTALNPDHLRIHLADNSAPDYTLEIISLHHGVLKLKRP
ncbi:hypothetical protein [Hymenobacter sp. PAMC 26628]|uniref:hypothetical protein n=1 Tax=Hymenobacter sp. PAMC 26628 TaxID=1484118 RepID=UPI00077044EC|nr:hypothetical protein [Hymenobacter sp. PAMC 26628]AMJ66873.1 hypothetical protein AXW84_16625 [Hymenobacter sp. PAMC 26628]